MSVYIYIHIYTYTYAYVYIYIYVCIHIRWTCTYIFKCPFKYIIYKHIYIYNTHINPVCEETLGPLVLEYIYIYVTENTPNVCFVFLQLSARAKAIPSDQILPLYIYIYVHMYMHVYIYTCMYTSTVDMHIYF